MEADKIILEGLQFYGHHGLFEEETRLGQKFNVDLALYVDVRRPAQSDRMEDGVHYGEVYERVRELVEGDPVALIETLTEAIAQAILADFDLVHAVKVKVSKPEAPIPGIFKNVAVEIFRDRQ